VVPAAQRNAISAAQCNATPPIDSVPLDWA